MKFAYSTNAYTNHPLDEAIRRVAALGFDGVEILADIPHAPPDKFNAKRADSVHRLLRRLRLPVSNVNANTSRSLGGDDPCAPSILDPRRENRRRKVAHIGHAIALAADLGAKNISVATGRRPRGLDEKSADAFLLESLAEVLAEAERSGMRVGIECEPGFHVATTRKLLWTLDRLSHPLAGANLDIGHCVVAGDAPVEAIRLLRGRIWNIHLEDIRGRVHRHLIPGEGGIAFAPIFAALRETGYDRFVTLELYPYTEMPDEAGKRGLCAIRKLIG